MKMKKKKTAKSKVEGLTPQQYYDFTLAPKKSPRPKARPVDKSPRAEMAASPMAFAKKKKKK